MRLPISLDTNREEKKVAGESKSKLGAGFLRLATVLITLTTVWVVVGSVVYPLWWFEFILKRGFLSWNEFEYGFSYLLKNVGWLFVAIPVAVLAAWLAVRKWRPQVTAVLDRFSIYVIICSSEDKNGTTHYLPRLSNHVSDVCVAAPARKVEDDLARNGHLIDVQLVQCPRNN